MGKISWTEPEPGKLEVMELRPHDYSIVIRGPWKDVMMLFEKIEAQNESENQQPSENQDTRKM